MPATIRSSSDFAAGQLVLQSHNTKVADDGFVEVQMNYACLASSLKTNLTRFRMEAPPPNLSGTRFAAAALPLDVSAIPLETNNIYLNELTSTCSNGIGYISALYVGSSQDQRRRIEITQSPASYSGVALATILGTGPLLGRNLGTFQYTESFDYTSETLQVAFSAVGNPILPSLRPAAFNIRNRKNNAGTAQGPAQYVLRSNAKYNIDTNLVISPVGKVKRYKISARGEFVQGRLR